MSNDMHGANATGDDQAGGGRRDAPQAAQVTAELRYNSDLAEANLLRMRGKWDEAIKKCAAILKQRPHDAVVHSLVGDIYRDQGRMDEAAQWYQMALDIDPASVGDRAKLDRLLATAKPRSRAGERWTLPLVLAVVSLSLLAVAGMLAMTGVGRARLQRAPAQPSPTAPPGLVPRQQVARPSAPPATPTRPPVGQPSAVQPATPPSAQPEQADVHSALELHLAQAIAQGMRQEVQGPVSVRSVILDPRTHSGIVTLYRATVPPGQDSAEIIQGEARTAGIWLLTLAPDIQRVTVRMLARFYPQAVSAAGAELAFVGDLVRSPAQSRSPSPPTMTDQWWHPRLAAVAPVPTQPATSGLVPGPSP